MATVVHHDLIYIVTIANHLLDRTRAHLPAIRRFEAGSSRRIADESCLTRYEASIHLLERLQGGQHVAANEQFGLTRSERAGRAALRDALVEIRDRIKMYFPKNRQLQRAYGMGVPLKDSTPGLLAAASSTREAWEVAEHQEPAVAAGIDRTVIDALARLHDTLSSTTRKRTAVRAASKTKTVTKLTTLRELEASTSQLRRLARLVFRRQPAIAAEFTSLPQGIVGRRRRKAAAAAVEEPAHDVAAGAGVSAPSPRSKPRRHSAAPSAAALATRSRAAGGSDRADRFPDSASIPLCQHA